KIGGSRGYDPRVFHFILGMVAGSRYGERFDVLIVDRGDPFHAGNPFRQRRGQWQRYAAEAVFSSIRFGASDYLVDEFGIGMSLVKTELIIDNTVHNPAGADADGQPQDV